MNSYRDAEQLWNDIIIATEKSLYEESKGLRNRLFLDLHQEVKVWQSVKSIIRIFKLLLNWPLKFSPKAREGKILFYFPFSTSANFGNLYPVFLETQKQKTTGLVIKTDKIKQITGDILAEDVVRYTSYVHRFKALYLSIKANQDLFRQFILVSDSIAESYKKQYLHFLYNFNLIILGQIAYKKILVRTKPCSVISTSDYFPLDYALFNTANMMGIRTFLVQHGIIGISHYPFTSIKMIVHGKFSQTSLLNKGIEAERVITGGMPGSDSLFRNRNKTNTANTKIKQVLVLSDTQGATLYKEVYSGYIETLKALVKDYPDIEWIVKLHPSESNSLYIENNFIKFDNFRILPPDTDLISAFKMADIAMTIWSTAGLEAIIQRKPLVVLDINEDVTHYAWWPQFGGGRYYSSLNQKGERLHDLPIKDILHNQESFLGNYFANKGESAEFISKIIANDKFKA